MKWWPFGWKNPYYKELISTWVSHYGVEVHNLEIAKDSGEVGYKEFSGLLFLIKVPFQALHGMTNVKKSPLFRLEREDLREGSAPMEAYRQLEKYGFYALHQKTKNDPDLTRRLGCTFDHLIDVYDRVWGRNPGSVRSSIAELDALAESVPIGDYPNTEAAFDSLLVEFRNLLGLPNPDYLGNMFYQAVMTDAIRMLSRNLDYMLDNNGQS